MSAAVHVHRIYEYLVHQQCLSFFEGKRVQIWLILSGVAMRFTAQAARQVRSWSEPPLAPALMYWFSLTNYGQRFR